MTPSTARTIVPQSSPVRTGPRSALLPLHLRRGKTEMPARVLFRVLPFSVAAGHDHQDQTVAVATRVYKVDVEGRVCNHAKAGQATEVDQQVDQNAAVASIW
jgi:hypothetical protein